MSEIDRLMRRARYAGSHGLVAGDRMGAGQTVRWEGLCVRIMRAAFQGEDYPGWWREPRGPGSERTRRTRRRRQQRMCR
jgi:hypothetical protein